MNVTYRILGRDRGHNWRVAFYAPDGAELTVCSCAGASGKPSDKRLARIAEHIARNAWRRPGGQWTLEQRN